MCIFRGMIIGEHNRDSDLEVNPVKAKALTNMRAAGKEDQIRLAPPQLMGLERLMSYIQGIRFILFTGTVG
jgi:GTP-binding protein